MARKLKKSDEIEAAAIATSENETTAIAEDRVEAEKTADEGLSLSDAEATNSDVHDYHSQCGGALRAERIAQALSTQAVAKQLRLSHAQIEALEKNDFSALPEPTIVKGFIRNYAKLLKISAESILAAYSVLMPKTEQYPFALSPGINMKITENGKSGSSRYLILTLLLLLGLGAWFFYQNYIQKPDAINPMPEVVEMLPEVALQMTIPEKTELPTVVPAVEEAVDVEDTVSDATVAEEASNQLEEEPAPTTTVAGKTRLEFNATQETWLSVVNTSGKEVYNKILYAGNRDVVDVLQPAEIVVGNAHGATLAVDGKPINLAPYTRVNVARVQLNP